MEQAEITLELHNLSDLQCTIADFLFEVQSEDEMQAVYESFDPREVEVVKQLMLAAVLDDVEDVSQASEVLQSFML